MTADYSKGLLFENNPNALTGEFQVPHLLTVWTSPQSTLPYGGGEWEAYVKVGLLSINW